MQLLLVEDDDIVTQVVIEGLSAAGFTVDCVRNLENASTALAAAHFDAVMLDLGLPDGDGGQWLKIRRAAGETVPVLIVTARASTDDTFPGGDRIINQRQEIEVRQPSSKSGSGRIG
jgi:two-component system response regulator QseB